MNGKRFYFNLALIVGIIWALDQITKFFIRAHVHPYKIYSIIPGLFNIIYVQNRGAIFGLFANTSHHFRTPFFYAVTIGAIFIIFALLFAMEEHQWLTKLGMTLILGGALGNFTDRVCFGQVTDFLDFYIGRHHWPAFNVADSAITIGIFVVLIDTFRDMFRNKEETPNVTLSN